MKKLLLSLSFLFLLSAPAFAQDTVRNGGDSDEIEYVLIAKKIQKWFQSNENLARFAKEVDDDVVLKSASLKVIRHGLDSIVPWITIKFTDELVSIPLHKKHNMGAQSYLPRVCTNASNDNGILCNRAEWRNTPEKYKYMLVFHEILGIMGIEQNIVEFSVYPLTFALSSFVNEIKNEQAVSSNILLHCGSKYSVQLERSAQGETTARIFKKSKELENAKLLDLTQQGTQVRAYIQIKNKILQCSGT